MFKQLWKYSGDEKGKVILFVIFHFISVLGDLGKPLAFAMILNTLQKNQNSLINDVLFWLTIYLLCFFVFEIFHRTGRYIERFVAFRTKKRFTNFIYSHLKSLPLKWHNDNHSGAIIDRFNKASNGLYQFSEMQFIYVQVFVQLIFPIIVLFFISPVVSIITLLSGLLLVYITKRLYKLSVPEYRAQNDLFHKVAAGLHDYISNITTIITLRLGKSTQEDINNRIDKVFPHIKRENNITQVKCFISALIIVSLDIGLIFFYIYSQMQSQQIVMIGSVTLIFLYLHQAMDAFSFYSGDYEQLIHWKTDFESIDPILKIKEDKNLINSSKISEWENLNVKNISFSYNGKKNDIDNVSVSIHKGEKIAFVGESGSGKSTLLKLLRGITPIKSGDLYKDNREKISMSSLSSITTLIPQEPEIFENTIHYNITMGLEYEKNELSKATKISCFDKVSSKLPFGLETDIREKGVNLSGGEKQRLALARGIFSIKDSEIVLLDEPTSNVDPAIEKQIFKNIFNEYKEISIISVLHRLHLVENFDYIYVFSKGSIVEKGTFNQLLENKREFYRLWKQYSSL